MKSDAVLSCDDQRLQQRHALPKCATHMQDDGNHIHWLRNAAEMCCVTETSPDRSYGVQFFTQAATLAVALPARKVTLQNRLGVHLVDA